MSRFQRRAIFVFLASALVLWSVAAFAQSAADRLSDRDVKKLIEQVDEGRDKFEGNLENEVKNSTVRGPNGETKVSNLLQDYQDNTKKLQDRFNDAYAAAAEVTTVLKQAVVIDGFMQRASSVMKGRREWDIEVASLKHLAQAYGVTFPLLEGAVARRMNDKETASAAEAIEKAADRFKDDLDKTSTIAKPDREAAKKDVELLMRLAETVKDRVGDGNPAMNEARQLLEQAARVQTFVNAHQIPAMANWQTVQASLQQLRRAFAL